MKWYLSGPITGYPELNRPLFDKAAKMLRRFGTDVLNPFDVEINTPAEWQECLKADLTAMMAQCGGIILLPGWPQSKGSRLELSLALALDWPVCFMNLSPGGNTFRLLDMNKPGLLDFS